MITFLEQLWKKEMDWDDPLDHSNNETWKKLTRDLNKLLSIQLLAS